MEYSNPEIPEGINTSKEHPLKEFLWLTSSVFAAMVLAVLLLVAFADVLTSYIPFSLEQKISLTSVASTEKQGPLQDYLQSVADRVAAAEDLPEDMTITVHYLDDDTVNAFATLGGHVFFFRGLLEKLPHENALAMLMAHEIAHIKHRHPIKSLGRGVIVGVGLSLVSAEASDAVIDNFIGEAGLLTILKFNRDMETEADATALAAVRVLYGHANGADELFHILRQESGTLEPPEFFNSHPLNEKRIQAINRQISGSALTTVGNTTPLPQNFGSWLVQ